MRVLLQRVNAAEVLVNGAIVGKIGRGLIAFVGLCRDDTSEDMNWIVDRMLG